MIHRQKWLSDYVTAKLEHLIALWDPPRFSLLLLCSYGRYLLVQRCSALWKVTQIFSKLCVSKQYKPLICVCVCVCGVFLFGCTVLVVVCRIFSWGMWYLVPWPGIKPGPPTLRVWSLNHWTTREVPNLSCFKSLRFSDIWYCSITYHNQRHHCFGKYVISSQTNAAGVGGAVIYNLKKSYKICHNFRDVKIWKMWALDDTKYRLSKGICRLV